MYTMGPLEFRQKLQSLGWNYAVASRQLGVSRGTITRWVRGERRIPETAIRLMDILVKGQNQESKMGPVVPEQSKVSQLTNIPTVRRILLFGSRARGLSDEHSDLDVAVVIETIDPPSMAAVEEAKWEALPEDAFLYANVVTISADQLTADTAFSRSLNKEGVELWTRSEKAR
jgi:transcriptional regulator with XRE-family HTH domain